MPEGCNLSEEEQVSSWETTRDMTEAEKFVLEAPVDQAVLITVAHAFLNLIEENEKKKIDDAAIRDVIKFGLSMLHAASCCGTIDFLLKQESRLSHPSISYAQNREHLRKTLEGLRHSSGEKAADWGNQLEKLLDLLGVD